MPDAEEVRGLRVPQRRCAEESEGGAIVVTGSYFCKFGVLDTEGSSSVLRFRPVQAAIVRYRDLGMTVRVHVAEINCVLAAGGDRRIAGRTGTVWNGAHHPGQTIVSGYGNAGTARACCVLAPFVGNVSSPIGRNANMPMQAAASSRRHGKVHAVDGGEGVNRNARAKGYAAIVATRAECGSDVLRAVVNRVRIRMHRGRGSTIWTAANSLVIDAGRLSGALRWKP